MICARDGVPDTVAARHQRPGQKHTRRAEQNVAAVTRAAVAADVAGEALARPRRRQTPARVTAAVATVQRLQRTVRGTLPAAGALRRCALLTQLALLVAAHCQSMGEREERGSVRNLTNSIRLNKNGGRPQENYMLESEPGGVGTSHRRDSPTHLACERCLVLACRVTDSSTRQTLTRT